MAVVFSTFCIQLRGYGLFWLNVQKGLFQEGKSLQINADSSYAVFFNPASDIAGSGSCPDDNIQFSGDITTG